MKNIVLAVFLFIGISASAQEVYNSSGRPGYHKKTKKEKGYDPSRLIIGGGLNAGYSQDYANAGISPIVGYRLTEHFSAGVGLGYQYSQQGEYVDPYNAYHEQYIKENIVYPSIWGRYFFYRNFFADVTVEYDFINVKQPGYDSYGNFLQLSSNVTNTAVLVGVGDKFPIAGRISLYGEIIYDVAQGIYSPYLGGPQLRFGICAGM